MSASSFLKERILNCDEKAENQEIYFYDHIVVEDQELNHPDQDIQETVKVIRNIISTEGKGLFWIDVHGCLRQISLAVQAIISLLKDVDGISPNRIYGIEYDYSKREGTLTEEGHSFEYFDFVSGMNDFINYGHTDVLESYYQNVGGVTEDVIQAIKLIAEGTQFCDPQSYREGLKKLKKALPQLEENVHDPLLSIFTDYLKKSFHKLLESDDPSPILIIERCIEKKLYQQALTFIESMMPDVFVETQLIYPEDPDKISVDKKFLTINQTFVNNYISNKVFLKDGQKDDDALKQFFKDYSEYYDQCFNKELDRSLPDQESCLTFWKVFNKRKGVKESGTKVLTKINSDSYSDDDRSKATAILKLHKALKKCRNIFNHGFSDNRPDLVDIVNCMKLYVIFVKDVVSV